MEDKPITLDEAASEFVNNFMDRPYSSQHKMWADIFRAGAEWQSQQTKPTGLSTEIIGAGNPWPLRDVINKLIEATEILLHKKNYDGHGWEEITHSVNRGKEIVDLLQSQQTKPVEDNKKD